MSDHPLLFRGSRVLARWTARRLARRPFRMPAGRPLVSFTFDDFPRSAWLAAGPILGRYGISATYYASLGLAGTEGPSGRHFVEGDLREILAAGHELGCHTHAHCPAWETRPAAFAESVRRNEAELRARLPWARFRSLSYPVSPPRAATKRLMSERFLCCRGGGQTHNAGEIDLSYLRGYFLEQAGGAIPPLAEAIASSASAGGWLILATHDVAAAPSRYGVTPEFLEHAVQLARASGAEVLPVAAAWDRIAGRG